MHLSVTESALLLERLSSSLGESAHEIVLCPSYPAIYTLAQTIRDRGWGKKIKLGAQDLSDHDEGAYTGEVSPVQLKQFVDYAIIGHSERRQNYQESDDLIARKLAAALRNDIVPILCVGETATERAAAQSLVRVQNQLNTDLADVSAEDARDIVVAYEPVWAISTEQHIIPESEAIEKMMRAITGVLSGRFGQEVARAIPLLYGGSVDESNAKTYLQLASCKGLLVGGASVNYEQFGRIANAQSPA